MNKEEKALFENEELRELAKVINEFMEAVKSRLIVEFEEGKKGYMWRDPANRDELLARLIANAADGDMVDVAAFAAFLWNIDRR